MTKRKSSASQGAVVLGPGWSALDKKLKNDIHAAAEQGKDDPAFERLMRSALNGRTDVLLGWRKPA